MRVLVAVALPERQEVIEVEVPEGATVRDALEAARLTERLPGLDLEALEPGIWARPCAPDAPIREGDRVELYRPLRADPKANRRARAGLSPAAKRSRSAR